MSSRFKDIINTNEFIFDTIIILMQLLHIINYSFLTLNFSKNELIPIVLFVSLLFTYYITKIAKNILDYEIFKKNKFLNKFIIITYFIIGIIISAGIPLLLKHLAHLSFNNNNIEAIFFISNILLTLVGFMMGYNLSGGFVFLGIFIFIYIWFGGIYLLMGYCVDNYSYLLPKWAFKTIGFIFMFAFPIVSGLLFSKILKNFRLSKNLKTNFKSFIASSFFKNLSTLFFAVIFCLWAELYYEITLKEINDSLGKLLYLIFSGVVPLRIILLLEPPIKTFNVILGTVAILLFLYNHL